MYVHDSLVPEISLSQPFSSGRWRLRARPCACASSHSNRNSVTVRCTGASPRRKQIPRALGDGPRRDLSASARPMSTAVARGLLVRTYRITCPSGPIMTSAQHPGRMVFLNLPVADLERSKAFR
ncbi:hypothetical protein GCM10027456_40020 [Kineosporia babensis]